MKTLVTLVFLFQFSTTTFGQFRNCFILAGETAIGDRIQQGSFSALFFKEAPRFSIVVGIRTGAMSEQSKFIRSENSLYAFNLYYQHSFIYTPVIGTEIKITRQLSAGICTDFSGAYVSSMKARQTSIYPEFHPDTFTVKEQTTAIRSGFFGIRIGGNPWVANTAYYLSYKFRDRWSIQCGIQRQRTAYQQWHEYYPPGSNDKKIRSMDLFEIRYLFFVKIGYRVWQQKLKS